MLTPLQTGLFDSIGGLPLHPLVVHFAVVLLPVAALGLVVLVAVPRWADRFGWLDLGMLALGVGAAFVAKQSGEALAQTVGEPATHATWGDQLPLLGTWLLVLGGVWFLLHRRTTAAGSRSPATAVVGVLAALLALGVTVVTVIVGHTGAQAAWEDVAAVPDQPTTAAVIPAPGTSGAAEPSTRPAPAGPGSPSGGGSATASPSAGADTMADVAGHDSAASGGTVVDGRVYNLTAWVGQHPGGQRAILGLCGTDGSAAFHAEHGGQGRPAAELRQFLIGRLG